MKVTIDSAVCLKHKLSFLEALVLLAAKGGSIDLTIANLKNKGILVESNGKKVISGAWAGVLEDILLESSGGIYSEDRLSHLASEMRACYPEGKVRGTPYYYRCNNKEVMLKMKKFFEKYGNYPDEKIIEATKKFVSSHNGDYKFLPLIKYFISKQKYDMDEDGKQHVVEVSTLASYLENMDKDNDASSSDWTVNIIN